MAKGVPSHHLPGHPGLHFTQLQRCLCAAQVVPAVRMRYMLAMILSYVETVVYCTQLFCSCTHCCTPSLLCTSVRAKPQHYIFWLRPSPPFSSLLLLLAMQRLPAFLHGSQPDTRLLPWLTKVACYATLCSTCLADHYRWQC